MNFPRFNKMKGMGQIVSWSVRDESLHCEGIIKLFHAFTRERDCLTKNVRDEIIDMCQKTVRLEDAFILGIPLVVLAGLLYLPFYFGFSSQAGGILPNLTNPTRGAQLWVMFAPLLIPLFAYLLYVWLGKRASGNWIEELIRELLAVDDLFFLERQVVAELRGSRPPPDGVGAVLVHDGQRLYDVAL
jgi:hypothetical protein